MFGEFDEAAYLRANPDVKGMIDRGIVRSGFEHWYAVGANEHALGDRASGFYEHDLMYDEAAYLRQNPDVAEAVRVRAVRNGYQHWIRFGRQEFARGVRLGPFAAKTGLFRPFVVALGNGAFLLVARAPEGFDRAGRIEIRLGTAEPVALNRDALAFSRHVGIVDACGAVTKLRLLVCAPPAELEIGRVAGRVTLSVEGAGFDPVVSVYRDRGVQAFFFEQADDANEFLRTARESLRATGKRVAANAVDFALLHLAESPLSPGYEKPLSFSVEQAVTASDKAVLLTGWVAIPREKVLGSRVWQPETCEFFDLTEVWSRQARADIVERFPDELSGAGDDRFGFSGVVKFTETPSWERGRLLFGVKDEGRRERWVAVEVSAR